jgi:hypothetical protein
MISLETIFWILFWVEVMQVAQEFVETVDRRETLVLVAQVILAELTSRVAEGLEQLGYGRVCGV